MLGQEPSLKVVELKGRNEIGWWTVRPTVPNLFHTPVVMELVVPLPSLCDDASGGYVHGHRGLQRGRIRGKRGSATYLLRPGRTSRGNPACCGTTEWLLRGSECHKISHPSCLPG